MTLSTLSRKIERLVLWRRYEWYLFSVERILILPALMRLRFFSVIVHWE
jgi:hypothetical protein